MRFKCSIVRLSFKFSKTTANISLFRVLELGHLMATIFFYNCGVAFHGQGVMTDSTLYMGRALYYYDMSYQTILARLEGLLSGKVALILLVAITNNLGQIYATVFDFDVTRWCHVSLTELLRVIDSEEGIFISEEDRGFFHLSQLFSSEVGVVAPAA